MVARLTTFIHPMLAREVREPFSDEHWLYEVKWDGCRAIAELKGTEVRLYSRTGLLLNPTYPGLVAALRGLNLDAVLDGEIVAMDQAGKSNLHLLEQYEGQSSITLCYQVFDLLYKDGHLLEDQPLLWRKQLLKGVLRPNEQIRYCDHVRSNGLALFQKALRGSMEGIMGKRLDSTYHEGQRSGDWLKIKTYRQDEAIIVGYIPGADHALGALILARYEDGRLCAAGRVDKGISPEWAGVLHKRMQGLTRKTSPLRPAPRAEGVVTWLKPSLVCSIRYTELAGDGSFRDPVFGGLRMDKDAKEVNRTA
jgi:bifunctional non-homologous end joining protein LigD